jgi:multidrug efflux pump subunit AcrA (membrane-fusion protein)
MNGRRAAALLLASVFVGACHRAATEAEAPEPRVEGARVRFPSDSPELGALQVGAPRETQTPTLGVNGRLAWDENETVRVYSPFGGRVTQIVAEPGQVVAKGDVLARLASSDFGQAEADAKKAASDLRLAERTLVRERDLSTSTGPRRAATSSRPRPNRRARARRVSGRPRGSRCTARRRAPPTGASHCARRSPAPSSSAISLRARTCAPTR